MPPCDRPGLSEDAESKPESIVLVDELVTLLELEDTMLVAEIEVNTEALELVDEITVEEVVMAEEDENVEDVEILVLRLVDEDLLVLDAKFEDEVEVVSGAGTVVVLSSPPPPPPATAKEAATASQTDSLRTSHCVRMWSISQER